MCGHDVVFVCVACCQYQFKLFADVGAAENGVHKKKKRKHKKLLLPPVEQHKYVRVCLSCETYLS